MIKRLFELITCPHCNARLVLNYPAHIDAVTWLDDLARIERCTCGQKWTNPQPPAVFVPHDELVRRMKNKEHPHA